MTLVRAPQNPVAVKATARVAFLDDDHVLLMIRRLLTARTDDDWTAVAGFFEPDILDMPAVRAIREGLGPAEGVAVTQHPAGATVLILRRGAVDRALLDANPDLRLVQRLGSRPDGIDVAAARERSVSVSCLPRPSLVRTAEHALLLMLALVKRLPVADRAARAGGDRPPSEVAYNWAGLTGLGGLAGLTLGIIGLGEVGLLVAERARSFGMRVLYTGRARLPEFRETTLGVAYRTKADLLTEADVVSLHTPGLACHEPVLGHAEIAEMRKGAFLVNTSRGWLVDEEALCDALTTGRLGGAGLDVHRVEPRPIDDPLCALDNVVLTPHIAGGSRLEVLDEVAKVFDNIRSVLAGGAPVHGYLASAA